MADTGSFRGKLFGGFDRRDVASYIEKLAAERNDYIVKCRDLETRVNELSEEIEELKVNFTDKEKELITSHEAAIEKTKAEYNAKLAEMEAALADASERAEERRTAERDAAAALLEELVESYGAAESDTQLLFSRVFEALESAGKKLNSIPEILSSAKERLSDIRNKIN